jgi:hypothetical protein
VNDVLGTDGLLDQATLEGGAESLPSVPLQQIVGRPLPPGYHVRALLKTDPPERLETPPKRLVIKPCSFFNDP